MDWLWDFSGRKPFWIGKKYPVLFPLAEKWLNVCACVYLTHCPLHLSGLNDRESRGRWEWVGGEPITYTNWRKSPARGKRKGTRRCVLVWRRAKWQIRDCKTGRGHLYMCYIKT